MGAWLKKAVLRGAGYEGLAENVLNEEGKPFGADAVHIVKDSIRREETRYKDELQWVHCLDTSGQVFAILLNCVYLLPLTWLFVRFFFTAYFKQVERRKSRTASDAAVAARKSFIDATRGVSRQLSEAVEEMHRVSEDIGEDTVFVDGDEIKREMKEEAENVLNALKHGGEEVRRKVQDSGLNPETVKQEFQRDMDAAKKALNDSAEKVKDAAANASDPETKEKLVAKAQAMKDSAAEAVEKAMENVKSAAANAKEQAQPAVDYAAQKAGDLKEQAGPTAEYAAQKAGELKDRTVEAVQNAAGQAKDSAPETAEQAEETAQQAGNKAENTTKQAGDKAKDKTKQAGDKSQETTEQAGKTAEATAESAKGKAEDLSKEIEEKLEKGSTSEGNQQQSEVDKFTSESDSKQKSPNGNGTGGDEASGQNKSESTKESEQTKAEKKKEDKIIDESQAVRDEDVDADGENNEQGKNA